MEEMNDYSGPFKPDLRIEYFSKDMIMKLLDLYSRAWMFMDGVWHNRVLDQQGQEEALRGSMEVWAQYADEFLPRVAKAANIEATNLVEAVKVWQITPDCIRPGSDIIEPLYDIKDENHMVTTYTDCCFLQYFEHEGKGREAFICTASEQPLMVYYFKTLGLDVEVTPLKLPPRKSPDQIACKWDWKLKGKVVGHKPFKQIPNAHIDFYSPKQV
jgi:hypothetical protein